MAMDHGGRPGFFPAVDMATQGLGADVGLFLDLRVNLLITLDGKVGTSEALVPLGFSGQLPPGLPALRTVRAAARFDYLVIAQQQLQPCN